MVVQNRDSLLLISVSIKELKEERKEMTYFTRLEANCFKCRTTDVTNISITAQPYYQTEREREREH